MAKIVKDTRQTIDVDTELDKIKNESKKKEKTKEPKKNVKKTVKVQKVKKAGFMKEVRNEVKKVKWPSKKDMLKYSIATIVFVIFFGLFFYLIDLILALLKAGV